MWFHWELQSPFCFMIVAIPISIIRDGILIFDFLCLFKGVFSSFFRENNCYQRIFYDTYKSQSHQVNTYLAGIHQFPYSIHCLIGYKKVKSQCWEALIWCNLLVIQCLHFNSNPSQLSLYVVYEHFDIHMFEELGNIFKAFWI